MIRILEVSESADKASLRVKYSGDALSLGAMDLAELVPALNALRRTLVQASALLNRGLVKPQVLIQANTRAGSYEFVLVLLQALAHDSATLTTVHTAVEIGKLVFGENGLVNLLKFLRGARDQDVKQQKLDNGSVAFSVGGVGNNVNVTINNTFVVTPEVAELYRRKDVRTELWPAVAPLEEPGIGSVEFAPESAAPSAVSSAEAEAFRPLTLAEEFSEDSFDTSEEIVEVVKASFDEHRRWKLRLGREVFGAIMADMEFQSRVDQRLVLFGHGDKLRIDLAVRKHRAGDAEYFIRKVHEVIRPPTQPSLLDDAT